MVRSICRLLVFGAIWVSVRGFAIDNEVIGIPQVQCSEDAVTFSVRSRNPFTGNIYIKGKYNDPTCRQEFFSNTFNGASLTVRIPQCGMRRIRQLQPQGMNYILVFVVNFHPQFVTKVDRAYNVRCFYAQQEKTVTSQLEVSMLATQSLEAATMLMPNCEYSVRADTLNGPRVRFVRVGDRLVHRWECDNPSFGMLVKNCFVNDGYGSSVRVLDSRGCPVFTPVIQGPLQYDNSLNLAYVEVWAYKFPDRSDLFFQCQIQVCNKRENECIGVTPPNCPLIPKTAFTPSSFVEPGVTGGFATFVRGVFPEGGNLVAPGVVNPYVQPYINRGPYENAAVAAGSRIAETASARQLQSSYGQQAAAVVENVGNYDGRETHYPPPQSTFVTDVPPRVSEFGRGAPPNSAANFVVPSSQEFVTPKSFAESVVNAERGKRKKAAKRQADNSTNAVGSRSIRLENEVMDVASESVYVADVTETSEDFSRLSRLNSNDDQRRVCLNPMALSVLLICFAVLVMIVALLLVYLLGKSGRLRSVKWPSDSSLLSIPAFESIAAPCLAKSRDYRRQTGPAEKR